MQNKLFGAMYALNIIAQAIVSLLTPAALMFCISWLLVSKAGVAEWIYAVNIPVGIICGLVSMLKFVLSATRALENLEKQTKKNIETEHSKNEKQ